MSSLVSYPDHSVLNSTELGSLFKSHNKPGGAQHHLTRGTPVPSLPLSSSIVPEVRIIGLILSQLLFSSLSEFLQAEGFIPPDPVLVMHSASDTEEENKLEEHEAELHQLQVSRGYFSIQFGLF